MVHIRHPPSFLQYTLFQKAIVTQLACDPSVVRSMERRFRVRSLELVISLRCVCQKPILLSTNSHKHLLYFLSICPGGRVCPFGDRDDYSSRCEALTGGEFVYSPGFALIALSESSKCTFVEI